MILKYSIYETFIRVLAFSTESGLFELYVHARQGIAQCDEHKYTIKCIFMEIRENFSTTIYFTIFTLPYLAVFVVELLYIKVSFILTFQRVDSTIYLSQHKRKVYCFRFIVPLC